MRKIYIIQYERTQFEGIEVRQVLGGILPFFYTTIKAAEEGLELEMQQISVGASYAKRLGRRMIDLGDGVMYRYHITELIKEK